MIPFGTTIPATVLQRSEILEGLLIYPVYLDVYIILFWKFYFLLFSRHVQIMEENRTPKESGNKFEKQTKK
jgi:hypothetical protein